MENNEYTYTEDLGEIKISDDVISVCVANAVLHTRGVMSLAGGLTNTLSKTIRKKEILSKGIKVDQSDDGVTLDVYVVVEYLAKIPQIAWDIQKNVKKEVENITEKKVLAVNVHVQGVE